MAQRVLVIKVKQLRKLIKKRINNEYDCNIIVTGQTGKGKSTFIYQLFKGFRGFKIEDKLTYSRTELIHLIKDFKRSQVWADELISSGFKRNFFDREQIQLIEILTKYRNNFNVVAGALPIFFTLDKELLKLFTVHIQVIKRGTAILHLPRAGRMYTDDIWDIKHNKVLEESWSKKLEKNPNFKIPYHKLSTFKAYILFDELSPEEKEKYENLKRIKREEVLKPEEEENKNNFYKKLLPLIKEGNFSGKDLLNTCLINGKNYSSVKSRLNQMLKDEGEGKSLRDFVTFEGRKKKEDVINNKSATGYLIDVNDL